jgi:thioredoxin reductase (NADPH)
MIPGRYFMRNGIIYSNEKRFEQDVLKSQLPVVVYFYSEDCPHCGYFEPMFERMTQIHGEKIRFVKIQRQENRQLSESMGIKNSPTVLFFKDGQEVCSRLNGYIGKSGIAGKIESIIGGACQRKEREKVYCDIAIIGGGPAGLSAAIYSARSRLHTVILEEGLVGGQVSTTFHVANYPGTNGVVRGMDLMENMKRQAIGFGTQIDELKQISEISLEGDEKHISTADTDYYAKTVIIATGTAPRRLAADGEKEFRGRGVHYCATCDGALYHDAKVLVVGGGNSAVEEAVFLTRYAKHVTIVHQSDRFSASKGAQDEVFKNPSISVVWNFEVRKINGDNFVKSVIIENLKTGEKKETEADGIFVYIGMQPKTGIFKGKINMDESGHIITDEDMVTNIPGVFAAGDVRSKKVRQIATAVGDGVIAGIMAERFISGKQGLF